METVTFGIIGEGITDQLTIERILMGFMKDKDLPVNYLQPKEGEDGNWDKVFKYCESEDFKGAFFFNDYVVIQIDTDFMLRENVAEKYKIDLQNLSSEEKVLAFRQKLITLMGEEFYQDYQLQILFAIAVNEMECWFLPIYFGHQPQKAGKTENCTDTLNTVLQQKEGFYIHEKRLDYYRILSKYFLKHKDLMKYASKNPSFQLFIQELQNKVTNEN